MKHPPTPTPIHAPMHERTDAHAHTPGDYQVQRRAKPLDRYKHGSTKSAAIISIFVSDSQRKQNGKPDSINQTLPILHCKKNNNKTNQKKKAASFFKCTAQLHRHVLFVVSDTNIMLLLFTFSAAAIASNYQHIWNVTVGIKHNAAVVISHTHTGPPSSDNCTAR